MGRHMTQLKAIETHYKGYRFRSRLEARWAVFFDSLGVKWCYEQEGYQLQSGWYLPDFWLPEVGTGCFVEIKPSKMSEDEESKINALAEQSNQYVMAFCGNPWPNEHSVYQYKRKPLPQPEISALYDSLTADRYWVANGTGWNRYYVPRLASIMRQPYSPINKSEVCLAWCRAHRYLMFGFQFDMSTQCSSCGGWIDEKSKWMSDARCTWMRQDYDCHPSECNEIVDGFDLEQAFNAARSARFEHGETPR
jgi:hypothetical protein